MFERKSYGPFPPRNYRLSAIYQYYIIVLLKLIFYQNTLKKKKKRKILIFVFTRLIEI